VDIANNGTPETAPSAFGAPLVISTAGNPGGTGPSPGVAIPSVPSLLATDDSGVSNTDHITNVRTPRFTGTGTLGNLVQIYANGQLVGQDYTDATGHYTVHTAPLADGTYQITAVQEDVAGNFSAASGAMSPPLVVVTKPPQTPTLQLDALYDTGTVGDNITAAIPQLYDGTAGAGAMLTLVDNGQTVATLTLPAASTTFSQLLSLGVGTHTLTAVANDVAGNQAASAPLVVTINQDELDPDRKYVRALYQQILGRPGNVGEWNFWTPFLSELDGRRLVATGIEKSQEARTHTVANFYLTYLGRLPGIGEGQVWVNALLAGATEEQVLSLILASPEYGQRTPQIAGVAGPATDTTFIQALYVQLLGRQAGPGEISNWLGLLPLLQRNGVAYAILTSVEYRRLQVVGFYTNLLGRPTPPAQSEVDGWVFSGLDLLNIRIGFESSLEYFNRVTGFHS
jgi:hypothetical protein